MTNLPPPPGDYPPPMPGDYPQQGNYPPPPGNYPPPPGNYPPPPGGYYPPPPPANYPPPPGGYYPPPPAGNFPPPAPGYYSPPVGNPVGQLPQQAYTPWLNRVGAALIDSFPILVLDAIQASTSSGVLALLCGLAVFGYAIWNYGYRQGTTGSSIGKSVLKFKVVSELTGQPIGFGMSVVRQLAHIVDSITFFIGYLFPLWDAKRQTLADKIMTTVCLPIQ